MNRRGVTLIEILIGMVIVAIASIGTLMYFSQAKGGIGKTGNRRAALERARQRLEQLMETNPTLISPADNNPHWLTCSGSPCTWTLLNGRPGTPETIDVEDLGLQPIETTVQWQDDPSAGTSGSTQDVLELGVKVGFIPGWDPSNAVTYDDFNRVYVKTLRTTP